MIRWSLGVTIYANADRRAEEARLPLYDSAKNRILIVEPAGAPQKDGAGSGERIGFMIRHPGEAGEIPFSRPLAASAVPSEGLDVTVTANAAERAALAKANGLPAVHALEARLHVAPRGAGLRVEGEVRAKARQNCVVTLEEFDAEIVGPVSLRFAPQEPPPPPNRSRRGREEPRLEAAMEEDDPPDPLIGGAIDLGVIASEFFALGLDPYPRKPGASFSEKAPGEAPETGSPFARLRDALGKTPSET